MTSELKVLCFFNVTFTINMTLLNIHHAPNLCKFDELFNIKRRHGKRKVHDYFLLLLCKSSILFTEQHIFKIIIYYFNTSKCATNYVISFEN